MLSRVASVLKQRGVRSVVTARFFSSGVSKHIVVAGGGTGGLSVAATLAKEGHEVTVIEPSPFHYYQPLWTLVGGGEAKLEDSRKPVENVMPSNVYHVKDEVKDIIPSENKVVLKDAAPITYDVLLMATGITENPDAVKGLKEALRDDPRVCTIYGYKYASKVWDAVQEFRGGKALFTFPAGPLKCAGAPQKIMYLAHDHWSNRYPAEIDYFTCLPAIFGVPKYSERLMEVCSKRDINVNLQTTLTEVDSANSIAKFTSADGESIERPFDFLHVGLPHKPVPAVAQSDVTDATGFVDVDEGTLQHKRFPNVFGIGDCTTLPTSKTAAAVSSQSGYVKNSIRQFIKGEPLTSDYNGYTSCPLITSKNSLILAEFKYGGVPHETFFWDQGNESALQFWMKKSVMPAIYWNTLVKGYWQGPALLRKIANPFGTD